MDGVMFSSQQMQEANNEVSRLQHFMQLYEFCRSREKKGHQFSSKTTQVCFFYVIRRMVNNYVHNACRL